MPEAGSMDGEVGREFRALCEWQAHPGRAQGLDDALDRGGLDADRSAAVRDDSSQGFRGHVECLTHVVRM